MATIHFKGKSYVQNHHLTLKDHHLVPNPAASLTDKISLHDNLVIHGDNLLALKALLPTYVGKVKCIYLDAPPIQKNHLRPIPEELAEDNSALETLIH
jgi:adenine-specific DNA-methyltransferase